MRINEQAVRIYPVSGISSTASNTYCITLEKTPLPPKKAKLPYVHNVEDNDEWFSMKFLSMASNFYGYFESIINENRLLRLSLRIISLISTIGHLAVNIYLLFCLFDNTLFTLLCFHLSSIVFLIFINIYFLYYNNSRINECIFCCYGFIAMLYLILAILVLISLYNENYIGFIIYIIFTIFSIGVIGLNLFIWVFAFLIFILIQFFEFIIRLIVCKLSSKQNVNVYMYYSLYYYDPKKTIARECPICLEDFKDNGLICISKCYHEHVFHEKCIVEWLAINPICPMCRLPADLA